MSPRDVPELEPLRSSLPSDGTEVDSRSAVLRRMVAQLLLDTTNEGIWLIDAQARTTFVNRHAAALLGYTEEEMIGMHVFEFMDEERRPLAEENLMRRQRGVEERQEVKLKRKDGRAIWVISSANPVYDSQGRYAGALALLGDLTIQKETEERLRSQIEQLKNRLSSMTEARAASHSGDRPRDGSGSFSLLRDGLRGAAVVALCGTYLGIVAMLTAGGVQPAHFLRRTAIESTAAKTGCKPETLRRWGQRTERDVGRDRA